MSDDAAPPPAPTAADPYGPITIAEIKPMRLEKAIAVLEERMHYLELCIRDRVASRQPCGFKLREMAALKALLREVVG